MGKKKGDRFRGEREGKGRKMVGSPFNSLLGSFRQHSHDFSLQGIHHKKLPKESEWMVCSRKYFFFFSTEIFACGHQFAASYLKV